MNRVLPFVIVAVAAVFGLSCSSGGPAPAPAGPVKVELPRVEKWEYKQVSRSRSDRANLHARDLLTESDLSSAGEEGWELVSVTHVVVPQREGDKEHTLVATFKRPKK